MTLHDDLHAAVNRRMELARAASDTSPSPWTAVDANHAWIHDATNEPLVAGGWLSWEEAQLIAANDPADTIRRCEADLRRLERHRRIECVNSYCKIGGWCVGCDPTNDRTCSEAPWPCPDVLDVVAAYGLAVPE